MLTRKERRLLVFSSACVISGLLLPACSSDSGSGGSATGGTAAGATGGMAGTQATGGSGGSAGAATGGTSGSGGSAGAPAIDTCSSQGPSHPGDVCVSCSDCVPASDGTGYCWQDMCTVPCSAAADCPPGVCGLGQSCVVSCKPIGSAGSFCFYDNP